jgi:hypothetical protein
MKHRERVLMSLNHEEPDRCPMQISFTPEFADGLRKVVSISATGHHNPHGGGNTYELERTLGEDMLLTSVGWANSYYANDSYNPVQPKSMEPARLKKEYGKRLCFWGSIDEQQTLPFGGPDDVRREVADRLETLGKSGGLIIGPTHHVQLDTPVANVLALVDAVRDTPYASLRR